MTTTNNYLFGSRTRAISAVSPVHTKDHQRQEIERQTQEFFARGGCMDVAVPLQLKPLRESTPQPYPASPRRKVAPAKIIRQRGGVPLPSNYVGSSEAMRMLGIFGDSAAQRNAFIEEHREHIVRQVVVNGCRYCYFDVGYIEGLAAERVFLR